MNTLSFFNSLSLLRSRLPTCGGVQIFDLANDTHVKISQEHEHCDVRLAEIDGELTRNMCLHISYAKLLKICLTDEVYSLRPLICSGSVLFSRAVARQVFSTLRSLTTVFGMGTGGTSSL